MDNQPRSGVCAAGVCQPAPSHVLRKRLWGTSSLATRPTGRWLVPLAMYKRLPGRAADQARTWAYTISMSIDGRDRHIVQLVARFKQLTSQHVYELLFHNLSSHTPCDRALRRLTESGYLARIERRLVGGAKGGSGQYVYQLGRRGFYLYFQGRYQPARAINYHTLAIADTYVMLRQLERKGSLTIIGISTEPDCHRTIGQYYIKPDLYAEVHKAGAAERLRLFLEIDMGTEGQRQIKDKFRVYWQAYQYANDSQWPEGARVVFVPVDIERANELRWLLEQGPAEAQPMFSVLMRDELSTRLR